MSGLLFNGKNNDMFHINIDNVSFFERNISIVSHLNQFYSKKEKNV